MCLIAILPVHYDIYLVVNRKRVNIRPLSKIETPDVNPINFYEKRTDPGKYIRHRENSDLFTRKKRNRL